MKTSSTLLLILSAISFHPAMALSLCGLMYDPSLTVQILPDEEGAVYLIDERFQVKEWDLTAALKRQTRGWGRYSHYIQLVPHPEADAVAIGDLVPLFHAADQAGIRHIHVFRDYGDHHTRPHDWTNGGKAYELDLSTYGQWEQEVRPGLEDRVWIETMGKAFWKPFLSFFIAGALGGWYLCYALNFKPRKTRKYIPILGVQTET